VPVKVKSALIQGKGRLMGMDMDWCSFGSYPLHAIMLRTAKW
jgi:hypothetical protein